jgi:hypothetical protein
MWIYRVLGDERCFEVGFMQGDRFMGVEEFLTREYARRAVHYLNGGDYDGPA